MGNEKNPLEICKQMRRIAAETLSITLQEILNTNTPISESDLRDRWLLELRKHKEIFPDGWYVPPPHGICVLFATDEDIQRTKFESYRWEKYWPSNDIFLNKEKGILSLYASAVHKQTGIIGDFGLTLYLGKNKKIQKYFKERLTLQKTIFSKVKTGMTFGQLYKTAEDLFKEKELSNDWWINITDPTGRNMGHTIPAIFEGFTKGEKEVLKNGKTNWQAVCTMLSKKRIFLSPQSDYLIQPHTAFSIEPRLNPESDATLPIIWFHTMVMVDDKGKKQFVTGFDTLFKLAGMEYMLN